jgi:hypothetical protein
MKIEIPVFEDLLLSITDEQNGHSLYPTTRLQKGLLLFCRGQDLAEEAVGFGLPVIKSGLQTIFPGKVKLAILHQGLPWTISADYSLNRVEKIARPDTTGVKNKFLYAAKNILAALIRQFPLLRAPLTSLSSKLRRTFGWETIYDVAEVCFDVNLVYTLDPIKGSLLVEAGLASPLPQTVTEMILMNEQGAHFFDQYRDSSGKSLLGKEIGCWDEVTAAYASFTSSSRQIAFTLPRRSGARLFRGRELIDTRLAWSGFGYSIPPSTGRFSYTLNLEKLP